MHSYFFGAASKSEEKTNPLLDSVLADANHKFFCGGSHVTIKGEGCCTSDEFSCHVMGEITNRSTLENSLGLISTDSQAQLVLKLFEKFHHKAFKKLEGNFIVILLDKNTDTTYLFRPKEASFSLYFCEGRNFLFASEIKLLLRCNLIAKRLNNAAISAYLQFGFIPSPLTPIENVNTLLPGYLLIYQREKVQLNKLQEAKLLSLDAKIHHDQEEVFFDLSSIIDQVFHLDLPQSVLFFPSIFKKNPSEIIQGSTKTIKKVAEEVKAKPISHLLKHLKPIFSKIYFSTHRRIPTYTHFKKTRVIFNPTELATGFKFMGNRCNPYCFFAKKYFEQGLQTMPDILLHEDAIFFPYIKHFKLTKDLASFKAGLIEKFQTHKKRLDLFLTEEIQQYLISLLEKGSLVDLDLLNKKAVKNMSRIQIWTLFVLEIWVRLCIDARPTNETLAEVHESFNLRV